jgi:hypothetical protein
MTTFIAAIRNMVDGGDVVSIDGMAQAETVGQQRSAEHHGMATQGQQRPRPYDDVGDDEQGTNTDEPAAQVGGSAVESSCQQNAHEGISQLSGPGRKQYPGLRITAAPTSPAATAAPARLLSRLRVRCIGSIRVHDRVLRIGRRTCWT